MSDDDLSDDDLLAELAHLATHRAKVEAEEAEIMARRLALFQAARERTPQITFARLAAASSAPGKELTDVAVMAALKKAEEKAQKAAAQ